MNAKEGTQRRDCKELDGAFVFALLCASFAVLAVKPRALSFSHRYTFYVKSMFSMCLLWFNFTPSFFQQVSAGTLSPSYVTLRRAKHFHICTFAFKVSTPPSRNPLFYV
jgi:hypothetical protein